MNDIDAYGQYTVNRWFSAGDRLTVNVKMCANVERAKVSPS